MDTCELRQLIGKFYDRRAGCERRVGWDMDQVILNGKQIATINRFPGATVGLMVGVQLTPTQQQLVSDTVAAARGGVKPKKIVGPISVPYELLDDEGDLVIPATLVVDDGAEDE